MPTSYNNYQADEDSFEMTIRDSSSYDSSDSASRTSEQKARRSRRARRIISQEPEPEENKSEFTSEPVKGTTSPKKTKEEVEPSSDEPVHSVKKSKSFASLFSDSKLSVFFGVVVMLFALYAFITGISYLANDNPDQSIVENNSFNELSQRASEVKNTGGPFGAILSNFLITKWLGLGSFVLIVYLVIVSLSLLRLRKCNFWPLTFKCIVTAIAVSCIAGAVCFQSAHYWNWGGEHGHFVNEFLIKNTGIWGDLAVNIILFSAVILIFFDSLSKFFHLIGKKYHRFRDSQDSKYYYDDIEKDVEDESEKSVSQLSEEKNISESEITDSPVSNDELFIHREEACSNTEHDNVATRPLAFENNSGIDDIILTDDKPVQNSEPSPEQSKETENKMEIVTAGEIKVEKKISTDSYDPTAELSRYRLPSVKLLSEDDQKGVTIDQEEQEENKERIVRTLNSYGIEIASIKATIGPTITLYEIVPAEGVRISKIKNLQNDMAMSLKAMGIRIIAPMPGKGTIGMEVPNRDKRKVPIRNILSSSAYQNSTAELPVALGTTISNEVFITDLAKMPHLLVAGTTGTGKSVGLNTIIASLLFKKHPAELKFVLIDPKFVEFSLYAALEKHFLAKLPDEEDAIITEPTKVIATLNSLCVEMDSRYELLKNAMVREIKSYNQKFVERRLNPEKGHRYLPYIVVIVDEFADLILTAGREIEDPISRIAAKARAVGIHLIIATQRPSVNVITGTIKANFPGRIAFRVNQMNDSRTILDHPGAEQLIGRGDMIMSKDGVMDRVQCALITTEEVEGIVKYISEQIGYSSAYELPPYVPPTDGVSGSGGASNGERDPLFGEAGAFLIESGVGSTTSIQRHFNVGFPRAGKIMDQLEMAGVVGPTQGGKPRKILMDAMSFQDLLITMDARK